MLTLAQPATPWTEDRRAVLDRAYEQLMDGSDCTQAMNTLSNALWWFRRENPEAWKAWVKDEALNHPVCKLVHNDPFTYRSFSKPRGFAGDAGLIDLIYYDQGWANILGVSKMGRQIYWRNRNAPAPVAVRERRDHMASMLDRTALRKQGAAVLAVAAGNLREALMSPAVHAGAFREIVAFDQDKDALQVARAALGRHVRCMPGSIRSVIAGGLKDQRYDFIYAAGLYDYLDRPLAARLTARLFDLLDEGGELLVPNFTHDVADMGYMESFMAWDLLYRSPDELFGLACELPASVQSTACVYYLNAPDIVYMRLTRT